MKKHLCAAVVLAIASVSASAYANDSQKPNTPATTAKSSQNATDKAFNEQMKKMRAAHDKMAAAKTPAERHAAMLESMQTMRESMALMHKTSGAYPCQTGKASTGMMGGNAHMADMMVQMMDQQTSMMSSIPMGQ
ncbi:hypothetical protein QU487_23060 [Crenobacter sp. SG2305]|uniref:hypothetical protein n=1 Tax=Crenobacter oryzisoli TaxID=3056844 RepID=UPI0025AB1717|nr:hypothetical protein [Crenobacter sp. SG2305]MDN0085579.1 hypothetical protein [Crenobacter sp. SG2305]